MKQTLYEFLIPTFFFSLLCFYLQTHLLFSPDVSYLIQAANLMLSGGKYGAEIFETNPPMILYWYLPICWVINYTHIDAALAARLYAIVLVWLSVGCSYILLKKLIKSNDNQYRFIFICTMLFVLLILPVNAFLQREHILLTVLLPYLLATALALENKSIHPAMAMMIGVMVGAGFALKPFFLVTFCLVESLFIIKKRQLFAWVRIESLAILTVGVLYLLSIALFQLDYIKIILPLTLEYYFPFIKISFETLIYIPYVAICLGVISAYIFIYNHDKYKSLSVVLFLGLLGMTIAFLIPRAAWYYHVLPAFGLSILIVMHLFSQNFYNKVLSINVLPIFLVAIILFYPLKNTVKLYYHMNNLYDNPNVSFKKVSQYLNTFAGEHSIYCFTAGGTFRCFPIVALTKSHYAERFPFFWWFYGVSYKEKYADNTKINEKATRDKQYLIDLIAEDLNRYRARWIIVDENSFKSDINDVGIISLFEKNVSFKQAWQQYRFLSRLDHYLIFERKVEE